MKWHDENHDEEVSYEDRANRDIGSSVVESLNDIAKGRFQ